MTFQPTHVVFSPPKWIDGVLHRGVVATDGPRTLHRQMDRDLWTVILFFHAPIQPKFDPNIDLYFTSAPFAADCPQPRLEMTARELIDETQFFPLQVSKEFDVVFNATWMPMKRHELFLDALRYAQRHGRPLRCLWFGYHYNDEAFEREKAIRRQIASANLDVKILKTDFASGEVNRRYNLGRCTLICSEYEAGPRVMGESLLAGVPFLVTQDTRGGAVEAICDENGLVCEPTGESIARAIWRIADESSAFAPRPWALENMCLTKSLERIRHAVDSFAVQRNVPINTQPISFPGYDWEGKRQTVRNAENQFRRSNPASSL